MSACIRLEAAAVPFYFEIGKLGGVPKQLSAVYSLGHHNKFIFPHRSPRNLDLYKNYAMSVFRKMAFTLFMQIDRPVNDTYDDYVTLKQPHSNI